MRPLWAARAAASEQTRKRALVAFWSFLGVAVYLALVGALTGHAWVRYGGGAMAVAAGVLSVWMMLEQRGSRRAQREAYDRWLAAEGALDAWRAALTGFALALRDTKGPGQRELDWVSLHQAFSQRAMESLEELDDPREHPLLRALQKSYEESSVYLSLTRELAPLAREVADARNQRSLLEEEIGRLQAQIVELRAQAAGLKEIQAFDVPASGPGRQALLRDIVHRAEREARLGRVQESRAAQAVLKETARWASAAHNERLARELLGLFDPSTGDSAGLGVARSLDDDPDERGE